MQHIFHLSDISDALSCDPCNAVLLFIITVGFSNSYVIKLSY